MPVEVILPKVDMDMATGRISRWYVEDGAAVKKGDVLFEIETDKAAMEIDAPASGTIRDITGKEGVDIPVGEAVAWIYAEGEKTPKAGAPKALDDPTPPHPASASLGGPLPAGERRAETSTPPLLPNGEKVAAKRPDEGALKPSASSNGVRATPLARRIAADAGLKLEAIAGSGPNGRVMRKDVEAVVESRTRAVPPPLTHPRKGKGGVTVSESPSPLWGGVRGGGAVQTPLHHAWLRQGSGRPFVLIHGFGSDMNSWRPMLGAGVVDAPMLGIDLPGHGGSPRTVPADMDAIADQVEATLSALDIGPITLAGHSFGAAVAATVAARGHADVRALALIAPAGLGPEINGAFLSGFARARSEASLMPWLKLLVADEKFLTRAFVNATLTQSADADLRGVQADIADRFFADGTQTVDTRDMIAGLHIPVRIIVGANDRIIPSHQAFGLPGQMALHVFQATGHMPQIERADAVLKIVLEMARGEA